MKHHPKELKAKVINALKPPLSLTVFEASVIYSVPDKTVYGWRKCLLNKGGLITGDLWSNKKQFQAISDTLEMTRSDKIDYCRQRGVHLDQQSLWNKNFVSVFNEKLNLDKEDEVDLEYEEYQLKKLNNLMEIKRNIEKLLGYYNEQAVVKTLKHPLEHSKFR